MILLRLLLVLLVPSAFAGGEVRIEGIEGEMLKNARQFVELYKRRNDDKLSTRWRASLHKNATEQIQKSLEPFGYYGVKVEATLTSDEQSGDWTAVYRVDPGQPVKITKLDLTWTGQGADRSELQAVLNAFPLKNGDVFVHKTYEDGKTMLQDAAYELGYVNNKPIEHMVWIYPDDHAATIKVTFDTGPLFHFGPITLHQSMLDPDLLRHYVNVKQGEPYSNQQLIEFQQALIASGWFQVVEIKPDFDNAKDAVVPIDVYFTPAKRHRLDFGLGLATDVGVRGSVRWTNKRINSAGHQAGAFLQIAPVKGTLSGNYQIPVRNPRTDRLALSSTLEYENLDDSDRDTLILEGAFQRTTLDKKNAFKLFTEFRYERFSTGANSDTTTNLLSLGGIVRRSVAVEAEFVRRGYSVSADLRTASSALLSDTGFVRTDLTGVYLHPIRSRGRLNLRSEIGFAWVEDFEKYPNSLRFFAGGDQSVRGYDYKTLGPERNGTVVGGKNLLVGSVEYDHRLIGKWVGALFVDAGNAYNESLDKIYVGAGTGIRWLAPFGSVRFDVAWPVSEDPVASDFRIHLGLGVVL